jgi:hypothetical protein
MKRNLFILAGLVLVMVAGCTTTAETILSEVIQLPPTPWNRATYDICKKESPYSRYFGVNSVSYFLCIYDALKILRVTLLSAGKDYVFEIQTAGDIELAKKKYGETMQFHIEIWYTDLQIFTASTMDEAVLVCGSDGRIAVKLNEEKQAISARRKSSYKVLARLKLKIDRDRMRIYVPKGMLPARAEAWWWEEWPSFMWSVRAKLALLPLRPIPTNLPDVFFLPEVYSVLYDPAEGSTIHETEQWEIDFASDTPGKAMADDKAVLPNNKEEK